MVFLTLFKSDLNTLQDGFPEQCFSTGGVRGGIARGP